MQGCGGRFCASDKTLLEFQDGGYTLSADMRWAGAHRQTLPAAPRLRVVQGRRLCLESEAAEGGR